jgi:hypothetical protein
MQLGKISTSSGSYLLPFASPHHNTDSVATLIILLTLEFVVSASALMARFVPTTNLAEVSDVRPRLSSPLQFNGFKARHLQLHQSLRVIPIKA